MRYIVIGAGAVGGTVGGLLSAGGQEVVLVARGAHGEALRSKGLELRLPDRDVRPPVTSVGSVRDARIRSGDVILLAVKSQDTAAVLTELAGEPGSTPSLPVLCMQNGVANEDLTLRDFAAVHGVCVNLPATHLELGVVEAEGSPVPGLLEVGLAVGGQDAIDRAVVEDLNACGFVATVRDDVMAWKRAKLLRNLGNATQALFGRRADPEQRAAVGAIKAAALAEAHAVFSASRLTVVRDEEWDGHLAGRSGTAPVHGHGRRGGSTWQSLERGAGGVETAYLNGEIVRAGRWAHVPTPANALLGVAMHRLVRDGAAPGSADPVALATEMRASRITN